MENFDSNINRRDFIKKAAIGGMAIVYGCSGSSTDSSTDIPEVPDTSTITRVALHKTTNRSEGVKKVMELLEFGSMNNKHVVLKPNFNTADPPPGSTHNDTLRQLVREIKDRSAASVTLGERSYQNFDQVIIAKGIDTMAEELDFTIRNFDNDAFSIFSSNSLHWRNGLRIPRTISNAEYIVTTCCLKTHLIGVITMSLKLAVGILPTYYMSELHASSIINTLIAEVNLAYKPNLIIMDGVTTFINGGPMTGTERAGNVIIAGTDRVAVDAVGTAVLKNLDSPRVSGQIFQLEQIKKAAELNIGIRQPNQIRFVTANSESSDYAGVLTDILSGG